MELAVESFACVQILQISLYESISNGKSEHASHLLPDFFDCNFIAVFLKFPCNINFMADFFHNFIFSILISIAGVKTDTGAISICSIYIWNNIHASGKDRITFPFINGIYFWEL